MSDKCQLREFKLLVIVSNLLEVPLITIDRTIIRTEINVRISLVICATRLACGILFKKLKYFEGMLNIFEFSRVREIVES